MWLTPEAFWRMLVTSPAYVPPREITGASALSAANLSMSFDNTGVDYRLLSLSLTDFACAGVTGRKHLGDPVYQMVTEQRQEQTERVRIAQKLAGKPVTAFYSSCGDLVHWHYFCLGVRMPWVNREQMRAAGFGAAGWRVQQNIALLSQRGANAAVEPARPGDAYATGDCLHINTPGQNNDHVMIVREHAQSTGYVEVAEYGQPGGKINTHRLVTQSGKVFMGSRQLTTVLRLQNVLLAAEASGLLVQPDVQALQVAAEWADEPPTRPDVPSLRPPRP